MKTRETPPPAETTTIERDRLREKRENSAAKALAEIADRDLGREDGGHYGAPVVDTGASLAGERAQPEDRRTTLDASRDRPTEGENPTCTWTCGYPIRSWDGQARNVAVLMTIGVDAQGFPHVLYVLGVCEAANEDPTSWGGSYGT